MNTYSKETLNWTLITIDDSKFVSGESICNVIQLVIKAIKIKFITLFEIYGTSTEVAMLEKLENKIIGISDLMKMIYEVKQFDWGDFFLFKNYPIHWNNPEDKYYPYLIAQTDTTIRAVDDQYIYIYTIYEEVIEMIKKNYEIESIKTDTLENLDYPY